jgi:cytochrome P450
MATATATAPTEQAPESEELIDGLPPGPAMPRTLQSIGFMLRNIPLARRNRAKYGDMFTARIIGFPSIVVISDPALIKKTLTADPKHLHAGTGSPLGPVLGANSLLAIDEDIHLRQRRILLPPFHGERMQAYADAFAEITDEVLDEWPAGEEFETLESMQEITLRAILVTIFGAHGASLKELEDIIPRAVEIGQAMVLMRFAQKDLGPWSPWGRFLRMRKRIDEVCDELMEEARRDPNLEERSDMLALLVQATHEDGTAMSDEEIRDQLMTMMIAGHETTASTLAWAIERLRRNPRVLTALTESVRAGEKDYLNAVFDETLRARPTVNFAVRSVQYKPFELGGYRLPVGTRIASHPGLTHDDPRLFKNPKEYRPERFLEERPSNYAYIPFGGGVRRCIGASFARMEFAVVMTRILERFDVAPLDAPPASWDFRGVTFAPGDGGMINVSPRDGS